MKSTMHPSPRVWWLMVSLLICMDAIMAAKMGDLTLETLSLIAEFANWDDRCRMARVSRSMRVCSNSVDHRRYWPKVAVDLSQARSFLIKQTCRCSTKWLTQCILKRGLDSYPTSVFMADLVTSIEGIPLDKHPGYSDNMIDTRVKQLSDPIKRVSRTSQSSWVCVTDKSDRRWAVNLHSEAKLDLSEFDDVEFVSDSLMLGHSVTNDGTHVFRLLHIHPVNPGMLTAIHTLRIHSIFTLNQPVPVKFKVIPQRAGFTGHLSVRIVLRCFVQRQKGNQIRFVTYDLRNPKPLSVATESRLIPKQWRILFESDSFSPDGSAFIGCYQQSDRRATRIISWRTNSAQTTQSYAIPLVADRLHINAPGSFAVIDFGESGLMLRDRINRLLRGVILPLHNAVRFAGWFTDEIFGVECAVQGSDESLIAAVSVSNPARQICFLDARCHGLNAAAVPGSQLTVFSDGRTLTEKAWMPISLQMDPPLKRLCSMHG